jgi:hypothetical protein
MNVEKLAEKRLLLDTIHRYNSMGWVAFYHPRLHTVSLNGGREIPEYQAVSEMIACMVKATVEKHPNHYEVTYQTLE